MSVVPTSIMITIVAAAALLGAMTGTVVAVFLLARHQARKRQRDAGGFEDISDSSFAHDAASNPDFANQAASHLVARKVHLLAEINRRRLWRRRWMA